MPQLTQEKIDILNRLISIEGIESMINTLSKWTAPDPCGFTGEFYQGRNQASSLQSLTENRSRKKTF